jgi:uncharacterized protein YgiM (DUF1202 family)
MKKIIQLLLLLAFGAVFGFIGWQFAGAKTEAVSPTQTAQPSQTATEAAQFCTLITGISSGRVNLRSCAGTSCGVLDLLTEGETLTILTAGLWTQVTNADGVTGYINSKYCEVKP